MSAKILPDLTLEVWRATRDTLWGYARVLGAVRGDVTPSHPFWWNITLHASPTGLTTTEIPIGDSSFELELDLIDQSAFLNRDQNECRGWPLTGQTPERFFDQTIEALGSCGVELDMVVPKMPGNSDGEWDVGAVCRYARALALIDAELKSFREELNGKTSPVQLFAHHFDLSLMWPSGRVIEGVVPADLELATEQMTFGFSTGDDSIAQPYFYATAHPEPEGLLNTPLPDPAFWNDQGFRGAVLLYSDLTGSERSTEHLGRFLRAAHLIGADLMSL